MKLKVNETEINIKVPDADLVELSELQALLSAAVRVDAVRQFVLEVSAEENAWAKDVCTLGFYDMNEFDTYTGKLFSIGASATTAVQQLLCLLQEMVEFLSTRRDRFGVRIPCIFTVRDTRGNVIGTM